MICLFGALLHLVLSDPLLDSIGFHYTSTEGRFYERLHPGTFFILLGLVALLWGRDDPIQEILDACLEFPAYCFLLALYVMLFLYITLRSGTQGMSFLVDTHMTAPICAIVLSHAPRAYCRAMLSLFLCLDAGNSEIGIAESIGRFRIFTFDPTWDVLHEDLFRASALAGHPLNNAMLTSIAIFIAMGIRLISIR